MTTSQGTALITGASTGIGAVYADRLARRGHDLVLVARDGAKLETLAESLRRDTGVKVEVLAADLSNRTGQEPVEERLKADDIVMLVNNAGTAEAGPLATMDPDAFDRMLQLNIVAAARLGQAVAPGLAARRKGWIVNMASVASVAGASPGISIGYSSSKAFLLAYSEGLDTELSPSGVVVQAVLPGATRTPIWGKSGLDVDALLGENVMDVDEMVDAALVGLDRGERVTIPGLSDVAHWTAFTAARSNLYAHMPARHAAPRYG